MPNPRQSKRKILAALVLGSIAVALSLFYREALPADSSVSHHQSYVDGLRLIEQQRFDEAKKALNEATGLPMLFPWATTALGHLEEARRNFDRAAAYFRAVPISSGAYPEAQLGLLRAGLQAGTQSSELQSQLQNLELIINQVRRSDLLPEVLTVKAIVAERANDSLTAAQLWREIRRTFPKSPAAKLAREQLLNLERQPSPQQPITALTLLDDAKQLISEGELAQALELTQQAKELVAPKTAAAFEALEVEEQILRNSGRTLEAETLLKTLAEQAPIGIGDLVLLRLAKKSSPRVGGRARREGGMSE